MADKIILRKGLKAQLPILNEAEFGFCTDTKELYVGSSEGNILINGNTQSIANVTGLAVSGSPSSTAISLFWGAVIEATSYDIYVNGVYDSNTTGSSTTISNLTPLTEYTITVRAKNATMVATGVSISATTAGVENLTTGNLLYYWNARDRIQAGNTLRNLAPTGSTLNATVVGATYDSATNSIPLTSASTDYISIPVIGTSMVTQGSYTMEYIFEPLNNASSGAAHELFANGAYLDFDFAENVGQPTIFSEIYLNGNDAGDTFHQYPSNQLTTQQRFHIIITFNASTGTHDMFINGVKIHTITGVNATRTFATTSSGTLDINRSVFVPSYNARFHAFRYYDRVLTTEEIAINVANGTQIGVSESSPTLGNVTNLQVSGTPTQTSISLSWGTVSGATSYDVLVNGTLTTNVTAGSVTISNLTAGTQYTIMVKAKNATETASGSSVTATTASPAGSSAIATTGLSFYYNAIDGIKTGGLLNNIAPSGVANNATVVGSSVDAGTSSIPLTPAVTDYIRLPTTGTVMETATNFTFEYIYTINVLPASNTYAELYNKGSYADHDYSEQVIYLVLFDASGVNTPYSFPTTAINTAKRYHLTIRMNDATKQLSLFLDGTLIGTQTTPTSTIFSKAGDQWIDFNISIAIPAHDLNFHATRFYNRALTDGEVATNFANGTALGL